MKWLTCRWGESGDEKLSKASQERDGSGRDLDRLVSPNTCLVSKLATPNLPVTEASLTLI